MSNNRDPNLRDGSGRPITANPPVINLSSDESDTSDESDIELDEDAPSMREILSSAKRKLMEHTEKNWGEGHPSVFEEVSKIYNQCQKEVAALCREKRKHPHLIELEEELREKELLSEHRPNDIKLIKAKTEYRGFLLEELRCIQQIKNGGSGDFRRSKPQRTATDQPLHPFQTADRYKLDKKKIYSEWERNNNCRNSPVYKKERERLERQIAGPSKPPKTNRGDQNPEDARKIKKLRDQIMALCKKICHKKRTLKGQNLQKYNRTVGARNERGQLAEWRGKLNSYEEENKKKQECAGSLPRSKGRKSGRPGKRNGGRFQKKKTPKN